MGAFFMPPETDRRKLLGVEIFSAGNHIDSEGHELTVTIEDLEAVIKAFNAGVPELVPVKFGHTSPGFNADVVAKRLNVPVGLVTGEGDFDEGALLPGRVTRLERQQNKLMADFDVLAPVAEMVREKLFLNNSVEVMRDYDGHGMVLSGVALLGAERPAVKDLAPLQAATILSEAKVYAFAMGQPSSYEDSDDDMGYEEIFSLALGVAKKALSMAKARFTKRTEQAEHPNDHEGQEGNMEEEIRELLGLGPEDDLIAAIKALVARVQEAEGEVAEMKKKGEEGGHEGHFSEAKFAEEIKKRDDRIDALNRSLRLKEFAEATVSLSAVEGTPSELAEKLVVTEEKMGEEAAKERLAEWQKAQKAAEEAGVVKAIGRTGDRTAPDASEQMESEVDEWLKKNEGKTRAEGYKFVMANNPTLYRAYNEDRKRVPA